MKKFLFLCFLLVAKVGLWAQEGSLDYFVEQAKQHAPSLLEVENLQQVGRLQEEIIKAQNNAFQVDATSEILVAPYFNSNGKFVDITTNPSVQAIGYDVGITNGGLYSAQVNITKNIFNKAVVDRLMLQNQLANESLALSGEDLTKNMIKNLTDLYIMTYQSQLQQTFTGQLIEDLQTRLKVVEVLVKRGLLSEADFLLVRSDLETRQLELEQIGINYRNLYAQLDNLAGVPLQVMDSLSEPNIRPENHGDSLLFERQYVNDSLQVMAAQEVFENQYRPQVSLYGNTGLNAVDLNNLQRKLGVSAGLKLTIPLYDGHQKKYNAMQNKLKLDNLDQYRNYNEVQTRNNLESLQQQIAGQREYVSKMDGQLKVQQQLLELFKGKLVQGQVSIIDYLNVIQNYKILVFAKFQARTNLWLLLNQYNYTNW
ncbi:TolC family protein [Allomuricauda sp. NBRC 101325]|uniref:TolC family protein n=1 Tax=Allomuricauda sp. NBRC 101325 TaxID=1113758 RepID=UPI0024A07800|nr:TolC family protein [Muricauda sp. NBRC 101325]GLU45171.1 hypothetical protein Musp01_27950 [Muricauda sp. NBRC 101325]